jgi:hypothetical protein
VRDTFEASWSSWSEHVVAQQAAAADGSRRFIIVGATISHAVAAAERQIR